jgi:hypothetical protein
MRLEPSPGFSEQSGYTPTFSAVSAPRRPKDLRERAQVTRSTRNHQHQTPSAPANRAPTGFGSASKTL